MRLPSFIAAVGICLFAGDETRARAGVIERWSEHGFSWKASEPLIDAGSDPTADDPVISIKDPTFVFHQGAWHLFATVRMRSGKVDMDYVTFKDWNTAKNAERHRLNLHNQYNCAPQIFYFAPHEKWYLVYQRGDTNSPVKFGPCFSTTKTISDPKSWTKPQIMVTNVSGEPRWLDFWVICDGEKANLFYTSLDGKMWRRETAKSKFPFDWSEPILALIGDIFEASHTYKIKGADQFLTIIEAQGNNRRYYKAYIAKKLEGAWAPLAATAEKPFAAFENIKQDKPWTTSISHGELFRAGIDETMEIDPNRLRFLFQGASNEGYREKPYGQIPWRLGILEQISE